MGVVTQNHILIAGASGVIGAAAVEQFARQPGCQVTALSRRLPVVQEGCAFEHIAVDLSDRAACAHALARLPAVTHLIYAAVAEAPGLVGGWYDAALIEANGRMFANLLDPLAAAGHLRHASLLQGAKAYGGHHHAVGQPCRESQPRDEHANFYWLQEDHLRARAQQAGFSFTLFRPQILLGGAAGVAMNPVAALGAYMTLTSALGLPCAYPGKAEAMWEMTDAGLLAQALAWAAEAPAAANQIFNITNGDVLVLAQAWPALMAAFGLVPGGEPPAGLAGFFAQAQIQAVWAQLAARHGLRFSTLPAFLGESHHYTDLLLSARIVERPLPMMLSTIKIRQAGFGGCMDSVDSLLHWLRHMVEVKLLPPLSNQPGDAIIRHREITP